MTEPKVFLNKLETAQALGVDVRTLHKWLNKGTIPVPPVPGMKPPKWRASDVQAFVAGDTAA